MYILSKIVNLFGGLVSRVSMPSWIIVGRNTDLAFCDGHAVKGYNNSIRIGYNCKLNHCDFIVKGNNNTITIGDNCRLSHVSFWVSGNDNHIVLGNETTVGRGTQFAVLEGTKIEVGNDCMFSHDILVRTSDSHSIVDINGNRINLAKDIIIGNHCWIGLQSLILKGSQIGDNSVLAARSTLNKCFSEYGCLLGGAPARLLKTEINWSRERL